MPKNNNYIKKQCVNGYSAFDFCNRFCNRENVI